MNTSNVLKIGIGGVAAVVAVVLLLPDDSPSSPQVEGGRTAPATESDSAPSGRKLSVSELPFTPGNDDRESAKRKLQAAAEEGRKSDYATIEDILLAAAQIEAGAAREAFIAEALNSFAAHSFSEVATFLLDDKRSSRALVDRFVTAWDYNTFETPETQPADTLEGFRDFIAADHDAAARFVEALPQSSMQGVASFELAEQWFADDQGQAFDWLLSLPADQGPESARAMGLQAAGEKWGFASPNDALNWGISLENVNDRTSFLMSAIEAAAEKHPNDLINWFEALNDEDMQDFTAPLVSGAIANADLEAAANIANSIRDPKIRNDAIFSIAMGSVESRPEQTLDWLIAMDQDNSIRETITHAAGAWTDTAPADVAQWLRLHPDIPARDNAILGMVDSASLDSPDTSMQWVLEINSPDLRAEAMEQVAAAWRRGRGLATATTEMEEFLAIARNAAPPSIVNELRQLIARSRGQGR